MNEKMVRLDELATNPALLTGDEAEKVKILKAVKARSEGLTSVAYVDINGVLLNDSGKKANRADREYIKKVRETKKPYTSAPSVSGSTGNLITTLACPILQNGQLVGFVIGTIELDNLSKLTEEIKLFTTGYGYLVDSSGLTLGYAMKPEFVGKMNVKEGTTGVEGKNLDEKLVQSFQTAVTSGAQQTANYKTIAGVDSVAVITPVKLEGREWFVVVAAPRDEVEAESNHMFNWMLSISLFFIALAILVIYFFAKRISKPIEMIRDECAELNRGDFSKNVVTIDSQDEIGQLAAGFNEMRKTLRTLIHQVQDQSDQVAASSEELTASAHQSAQASEQVAVSVTQIASGIVDQTKEVNGVNGIAQNMSASAEEIAAKASEAVDVTRQTSHDAGQGREAIAKAVDQMEQIGEGSKAIQEAITKLDKGSQEISNIVELISNIAGQTNLLALNAAIEAARAGEQGRGFAVVAEEVRKLAEESERSSQKIGDLINRNLADMKLAVEASRAEKDRVTAGIEAVQSADGTFKTIVEAINNLAVEIGAISTAIHEMAQGSEHVVKSISQVTEISNKNALETESVSAATEEQSASMEEISSASQSLADLASELQAAVAKFKV